MKRICIESIRIGQQRWYFEIGQLPIVGTIANNVRPIDRKAIAPSSKGTLSPILKWANSVGNQWVESTVRSYRRGE